MLSLFEKLFLEIKTTWIPEVLSKEFSLKCLSVMIYKQFIVSIVELIMLSWQQILLHSFQNTGVTWLFYHFFKLKVRMLHGLGNISILIFGNCDLSYVTSFQSHISEDFRKFLK